MESYFFNCLGFVAPYYNMVLVLIVIALFAALFKKENRGIFIKPWKFLFFAILVYVIEELLTITNGVGITNTPRILNSLFEMVIITSFIYMLLIQREYVKSSKSSTKSKPEKSKK